MSPLRVRFLQQEIKVVDGELRTFEPGDEADLPTPLAEHLFEIGVAEIPDAER